MYHLTRLVSKELQIIPGFIMGGHIPNNIRYAYETVLISGT